EPIDAWTVTATLAPNAVSVSSAGVTVRLVIFARIANRAVSDLWSLVATIRATPGHRARTRPLEVTEEHGIERGPGKRLTAQLVARSVARDGAQLQGI